ncbi:DUF3488 and transglutaminase-like domain-containing protein [Arthrobacter crystallopoietes]|uniref:Transglutaminase-like superfamily protein n=1 Tax=Crystallibacter crystallopoietes TaxID=37928 RepID=A0A1H0ZYR4_9MICC|nr:DUF3488 and transglutaminase-like domain-containing protein [Arthrobacter crystallopoietes]AUI51758.1 hypothetical protein AC20117_14095 [Arthrobacter crystallopoietes]SDQ32532.1 Transglutaminase-like superfamily protein [Arthrobacter crystallopoietes]
MTATLDRGQGHGIRSETPEYLAPDNGSRRRLPTGSGPWLMSAAIAAAVVLTAANLNGVIEGWAWLGNIFFTVLCVEAGTALGRALNWPAVAATLLGLGGLIGSVTLMFFASTSFLGVFPGPGTFRALEPMVDQAQETVISQVAPVLATPGIVMVACVGIGLVALLVDTVAVPLQMPATAGGGLLAVLMVPAIIKPNSLGAVGFVAAAIGFLLILGCAQWLGGDDQAPAGTVRAGQFTRAASIGAAGLAVTLLLPLAIPGFTSGAFPQGSRLNWLGAPTGLNPIVSLGDNLRRPGAFGRMTYATDSTDPLYIRSVTLENLAGARWRPTDPDGVQRSGVERIGTRSTRELMERGEVTTTVISTGSFTSPWLPVPYAPAEVDGLSGNWTWDPRTLAIRGTGNTTSADQEYTVRSVEPVLTREGLESADSIDAPVVDDIFTELPDSMPDIIEETTDGVLDGLTEPYEQAMAIQSYLRGPDFVYSEDAPVDGGYDQSGFDVVGAFLEEKSGYCTHYASTMAIMARTAGIPSRIAVGYAPGDETGEVLEMDGRELTEFEIDSRDAHAWPELYFEDLGWVAFEPTPGRGAVPDYAQAEVAPVPNPAEPENLNPRAGPTLPLPSAGAEPEAGTGTEAESLAPRLWSAAGAAVLLLALLSPMLLRTSRTRKRRTQLLAPAVPERESALLAWEETLDVAADYGEPSAPEESARAFNQRLAATGTLDGEPAAALERLRTGYEHAAYSNPQTPAQPPVNSRRWEDVMAVAEQLKAGSSWQQRLLGRFLPQSLFRRR